MVKIKNIIESVEEIKTRIGDKQVHIFPLMGQSNMVGGGGQDPIEREINDRILYLDLENKLQVVEGNLYSKNTLYNYGYVLGIQCPECYSLGIKFADEMIKQYGEDDIIVLVPCARGMSTINEQIDHCAMTAFGLRPPLPLYGMCQERVDILLNGCENASVDAVLYYQGESDCGNPDNWKNRMLELISKIEKDFPNSVFMYAQLAGNGMWTEEQIKKWNEFKIMQCIFAIENDANMVYLGELPLIDGIHLTTRGLEIAGWKFSKMYKGILNDNSIS